MPCMPCVTGEALMNGEVHLAIASSMGRKPGCGSGSWPDGQTPPKLPRSPPGLWPWSPFLLLSLRVHGLPVCQQLTPSSFG